MKTIYQALVEIEENGTRAAFCIVVKSQGSTPRHASSKMLVYPDGHILGSVGGGELENRVIAEAQLSIQDGKPRLLEYKMADPARGDPGVCGGQVEVYVEPLFPPPTLLIIGAGHVGKAVAHLAKWLGFRIAVSDDRAEFCNTETVPDADAFYPVPMAELPQHLEISPQTYIVLTTRGVTVDVPGLPALLETPASYIGIIGSRRRWETTTKELIKAGIPREKIERVHSPIGLGIGAETPEEIAVSILAEILMIRNAASGKPMKVPR